MSFQQFNVYPTLTPVRLASTSNIAGTYNNGSSGVGATLTIAASSLTVDSVVCAVGDRLLLQTQTNTNEQGIYVVTSIGSTVVLTRSADLQCNEQLKGGMNVAVAAGSLNAGNFYTLVEPLPAQLGVNALVFNADPGAASVSFSGAASTANAIPVFSDTAGNIKAQTTTATLGFGLTAATGNIVATAGNLVAGSSGNAGTVTSFPTTASKGSLKLAAVDNTGNTVTTISNAAMGQASVVSIPDPGQATSNFVLTDSAGTQTIATGSLALTLGSFTATAGDVQAGSSGHAGVLKSFPGTAANGFFEVAATNAGGAFNTILTNRAMGQTTTFSIGDPGQATASILTSKVNADAGANLISFDVTCGQAALAAGGSVTLYASSGAKQFKVRSLFINSGGTNFSGGGGDRLGQVTDGTTVYSVIPATNMQTLVNAGWGINTVLPFPAAAAINTSTAAGASLVFKYSGGTTDYTAGSIVVSGILERVA